MLSIIAKIFDPLGCLAPVIISAKLLIQEVWTLKVDWDQQLPPDVIRKWTEFLDNLQELAKLEVPRWMNMTSTGQLEIHGFCDASSKAIAAVVFCRNADSDGIVTTRFMCAKTKVAPLKRLTIPRLELSGAVLLTKLVKQVLRVLQRDDLRIYLWTDSTITLTWITAHPSRWKEFVHNRVCFIQDTLPTASWKFVLGIDNPADLATRGVSPSQLMELRHWWHGPGWLTQNSLHWPSTISEDANLYNLEERPIQVCTSSIQSTQPWDLICKYSDLNKLLRITALCQRAIKGFRRILNFTLKDPITPIELKEAKEFWIKEIQRCAFRTELKLLSAGRLLPKSNHLIRFTPFVDSMGILRIGGRLRLSQLPYDAKHPAIYQRNSC